MKTCKYDRGFYGGKFLPFHSGHKYCIGFAAQLCRELYVIFFSGSEEEKRIIAAGTVCGAELLDENTRIRVMEDECAKYPNVRFRVLDCGVMHREALLSGTDVWDSETPYVLQTVGEFQAVFSSEPSYGEYFSRAYPWAEHVLIDVPRIHVPISGTDIRNMTAEESAKWL